MSLREAIFKNTLPLNIRNHKLYYQVSLSFLLYQTAPEEFRFYFSNSQTTVNQTYQRRTCRESATPSIRIALFD